VDLAAAAVMSRDPEKAPTFGGAWVDRASGVVDIAVTSAAAERATFIGSEDPALFRFRQVKRSWAELGALRDRIARAVPTLRAAGVDVSAVYPQASTNDVVVEVRKPTDEAESLLRKQFGAAVSVASAVDTDVEPATDRLNDVAPWNGGDFITSRYESTCTAGPPGYRQADGRKFIITAGHCWPASRAVYNARNYPYSQVGSGRQIGVTAYNDVDTALGLDVAIIDTQNYGGSSSLDFRNSTVTAAQQNWGTTMVNAKVCSSGAYELEVCGATVTVVGACIPYSKDEHSLPVEHCNMSRAVNYNTTLLGNGDSGGPVYLVDKATLKLTIYGIVSAHDRDTQYVCPTLSDPANPRYCSHIMWFTNIVPILHKYGMALNRSS